MGELLGTVVQVLDNLCLAQACKRLQEYKIQEGEIINHFNFRLIFLKPIVLPDKCCGHTPYKRGLCDVIGF